MKTLDTGDNGQIERELEMIEAESEHDRAMVERTAREARSPVAAEFACKLLAYDDDMQRVMDEEFSRPVDSGESLETRRFETASLSAEYALDLARTVVRQALCSVLVAAEMQTAQEHGE